MSDKKSAEIIPIRLQVPLKDTVANHPKDHEQCDGQQEEKEQDTKATPSRHAQPPKLRRVWTTGYQKAPLANLTDEQLAKIGALLDAEYRDQKLMERDED